MREKIIIIVCEVGKEARVVSVENELEDLQNVVGGNIEFYDLDDEISIICNEEGKINGMGLNRVIRDEKNKIIEVMAGDFIIVGSDYETGDIKSLTEEQIRKLIEKYKYPEHIYKINDEILAEKYKPRNNEITDVIR